MDRHLTLRTAPRLAVWTAAAASAAVAWVWLGAAPLHQPHHGVAHAGSYLQAVGMWQAMMVAMMMPAVAPWIAAYARLVDGAGRAVLGFTGGYFVIWLVYSIVAAALQQLLARAGVLEGGALARPLAGIVLMVVGAYQLSAVRAACLTHCRNPLTYFLARWHDGPIGGFRLGVEHGAWCVGCCWALMLTAFALGVMNLAWMAVLTALVAVEQIAPAGAWIGRAAGGGFVLWGLLLLR